MNTFQLPANPPPWMPILWKEIGVHEQPENRGPAIRKYIAGGHVGQEGWPWCAIFENYGLETAGFKGTRSAAAQSFCHDPNFVKLAGPAFGAITVYWRTSRASGLGHVGNYIAERNGYIATLGGNEGDMVQIEPLAANGSNFGLLGYWWPKSYALPKIGAIIADVKVPLHQVAVV